MIQGMVEDERVAIAELHAAMGTHEPQVPSTRVEPAPPFPPAESFEALESAVRSHPFLESFEYLAQSKEDLARAKNAERYPSFTIGADWILTSKSEMAGVADSGKDAVVVGAGMSLPLWQGNYADGAEAARAEAKAERSARRAAEDRAIFELEASLAEVRDAARRVGLHKHTLVPQAESAYASVLGAYATGEGSVAQTLLAQRDLLDLRGELESARAEHALAWARLERVVGREVLVGSDQPQDSSEQKNEK
jgi:outer membrane protein TolC